MVYNSSDVQSDIHNFKYFLSYKIYLKVVACQTFLNSSLNII